MFGDQFVTEASVRYVLKICGLEGLVIEKQQSDD